ncbi:MAG: glycosyl transferase [Bacteroidetes bacterium GWE2_39_28]|nr:MAG: glycosyl transferase [Bacteroidetes bacterium GWE2_39_28]OFY13557.1 MAG: glycosyl transferase [Bacteroidetes bacterium GWF2_39_10]OFZ07329.1 MAG: glycosyl transferase [Bacteroidetes bacterium RIFOXYB2_FULL_39_7]OFZ11717.1 MAG: glycosyl transferase [Bacteroidetes bacterium RIFOXYC2_FULL_39_11]HCT94893.1 glycosyltransferase family 4 protein [Rikenellaceae bacterium]
MSLKIAYCIPSLYSVSGMEKTLTIKANYFAEVLNYKIIIILTDGKGREPAFSLSPKIEVINLNLNYDKIWSYPFYIKVFAYALKQILFRRRLTAALKQIKPQITVSMLRRDINFITKIKDGSIKIGEIHFSKSKYRDLDSADEKFSIKGLFAKLWMRQLIVNLKRLQTFVVLSYEDKEKWVELNNVSVIYNPIINIPAVQSDCASKNVIAAGRFVRQKGYDMLLESWAIVASRHPDWTLSIYGSGEKRSFQEIIDRLGIEKTCILYDAVQNLNEKFTESSIFAFSSRYEGFGMVITEAMACGIPPVAFACQCGPRDIITHGKDGFLIEPENTRELAEKICTLIEDDQLRKSMGLKARERAERFTLERVAKEWDALFKDALKHS